MIFNKIEIQCKVFGKTLTTFSDNKLSTHKENVIAGNLMFITDKKDDVVATFSDVRLVCISTNIIQFVGYSVGKSETIKENQQVNILAYK